MLTFLPVLLLAAADAGAAPPAEGWDGGFDARVPASWTLGRALGPGTKAREALVADLTARGTPGQGEAPLTREEAIALLDDPRAQLAYGEKTVSIVAPSMPSRHRQEHLDLMQRFLQPERVEAGKAFAARYGAELAAVEARTGVAREVIIGILMWESKLGTITGDWVAFNMLATQAFLVDEANAVALSRKDERLRLDPAAQARRVERIRSRARANLLALVRQCRAKGIDVFTMKGSWAGALGFPQFMPASLRWAADGDGDGVIDLFHMPDAIASVGRYLSAHGYARSPREAVFGYNHEDAYVDGVLAFAGALAPEKKLGRSSPTGVPSSP